MSNSLLKPSDFNVFPCMSVFGSAGKEAIALNIMQLLVKTGDAWRQATWREYVIMYNPGKYSGEDEDRFDMVKEYCESPDKARTFSRNWESLAANRFSYTRFIKESK